MKGYRYIRGGSVGRKQRSGAACLPLCVCMCRTASIGALFFFFELSLSVCKDSHYESPVRFVTHRVLIKQPRHQFPSAEMTAQLTLPSPSRSFTLGQEQQ
jgi:hypothetical protein